MKIPEAALAVIVVLCLAMMGLLFYFALELGGYSAQIWECESTLPRDQNCVLVALPEEIE